MIKYRCGCTNETHEPSGILRSIYKCRRHQRNARDPATLDEAYYAEFGLLKDGQLQQTRHIEELTEALGLLPRPVSNIDVLEIGCGISPYAETLLAQGWRYQAIEPSLWAATWMWHAYGVSIVQMRFDDLGPVIISRRFSLILAAHSIEHMEDAPAAIARCAELLVPGGELWIIVPDDSDPLNADHLWFFTEATLRSTVESAGLRVQRLVTRRIIARENFIYCRAIKP